LSGRRAGQALLLHELLDRISSRNAREVRGIKRMVCDISSKSPGMILNLCGGRNPLDAPVGQVQAVFTSAARVVVRTAGVFGGSGFEGMAGEGSA